MFHRRRLKHWGALLTLVAGVASCLSASVAADAVATVDISKLAFGPREITIAPGSKVRWVNHDQVPHAVASAQGQGMVIASKAMGTDGRYEATFPEEGDYSYYCTVHPFMTGAVHVRKP